MFFPNLAIFLLQAASARAQQAAPVAAASAPAPTAASAPAPAAAPGYVVLVQPGLAYLDAGEAAGASVGQEFTVFVSTVELKHPVTGESLGFLETPVAQGRIERVLPKYSIGAVSPESLRTDLPLAAGQRFRLKPFAGPAPAASGYYAPPPAFGPGAAPAGPPGQRRAIWHSPPIDMEAADMAAGDVDGGGKPEIIVGEGNRILVYPGDGSEWKVKYSFEGRATGMKVASLDTADLDKDGKDEIFVTVNNTFLNRLETYVLKWENGSLVQVATLPWMSRAYEDESGARRIASQQLLDDPNFPLGAIYPLEYRDGKYVQAGPPLRLSRLEWIYSFALAQEPETKQLLHVSYSTTSRIRAQFLKKPWLSPDAYGQTSSRVRWHDKPFMFGPRLILDRAPGKLYLYALQNVPAFGMLANAFGYYSSSRLQKLDWSGASFDPEWTVEIPAYTADIAVVRTFSSEEIYAAVVTGGKTSIWKFVP